MKIKYHIMKMYIPLIMLVFVINTNIFSQVEKKLASSDVMIKISDEGTMNSNVTSLLNDGQTLNKIAENTVSSTTKVFTFKVMEGTTSEIQDNQNLHVLSKQQQQIIDYFLAITGVAMASYDKSTNTYTVVADNLTQISSPLKFD